MQFSVWGPSDFASLTHLREDCYSTILFKLLGSILCHSKVLARLLILQPCLEIIMHLSGLESNSGLKKKILLKNLISGHFTRNACFEMFPSLNILGEF